MPVNQWLPFSLALLILFPCAVSTVNQQGEALLLWKESLKGSPAVLNNWDERDETPCGWYGVSCDYNNQVSELELRYVDLFGMVI